MLGIIGAMSVETDGIIARLTDKSQVVCGNYIFTKGFMENKEVVVCRCGIGKVFSSTAAALMIEKFSPSAIINLGVAGGVKPLKQGDIVISQRTVQHDYDGTADGLALGQVHGFETAYFDCDGKLLEIIEKIVKDKNYSYKIGVIATGDCFVSNAIKAKSIAESFNAVAFDMESAAIHQVCAVQKVPFIALRAISDNGDEQAVKSFYEFVTEAAEKSISVVSELIKNY